MITFSQLFPHINFRNLVLIPTFIFGIYLLIFSSDRYVSESTFTIKTANSSPDSDYNLSFLGLQLPNSNSDNLIIESFVGSYDMLDKLNGQIQLSSHYQQEHIDWFSRLSRKAKKEELHEYFKNYMSIEFDEVSGLLSISVEAFDPGYAQNLLRTILNNSELFVNQINYALAQEKVSFITEELERAQKNLKRAKKSLLSFQDNHQLLSPEIQTQSLSSVMFELEGELVREQTRLKQLLQYQNKNAPEVINSQLRIDALDTQITDENKKLVGSGKGKFNELTSQYQDLLLDTEFALNVYKSVLTSYELARTETSHKLKHLVVVDHPNLPEEARYPEKLYLLATTFILLILTYGIIQLGVATINEHQDQ